MRDVLIHRQNRQSEADRVCVQHRRGDDFVDELEQLDRLLALDSLRETNLGERAANERAQSEETAMEYVARAATDSHVPGSENLERQNRGVEQVSQLVCEEFQSVGAPRRCDIHGGLIPLTSIFGDRPGNRIVEASVQHAEIRDC